MENLFITVEEVSVILRKNPKWVYNHKEKIPGFFRLEGAIFFDREILISHLKELAFKPTKKAGRITSVDRHGLL